LCDVLHAATDNAVAPVTAKIASRISCGFSEAPDIIVSPIAGLTRANMYPL
jgi:hypothetical protein